jgi:endonuclease YncB( thermonuclease family)
MRTYPEFASHPYSLKDHPPVYRAHCYYVVDGDTADFLVDLGFGASMCVRVRFVDVFAPEIHGITRDEGLRWARRVVQLIENQPVLLYPQKEDRTFDRWVASVHHVTPTGFQPIAVTLRNEFGTGKL